MSNIFYHFTKSNMMIINATEKMNEKSNRKEEYEIIEIGYLKGFIETQVDKDGVFLEFNENIIVQKDHKVLITKVYFDQKNLPLNEDSKIKDVQLFLDGNKLMKFIRYEDMQKKNKNTFLGSEGIFYNPAGVCLYGFDYNNYSSVKNQNFIKCYYDNKYLIQSDSLIGTYYNIVQKYNEWKTKSDKVKELLIQKVSVGFLHQIKAINIFNNQNLKINSNEPITLEKKIDKNQIILKHTINQNLIINNFKLIKINEGTDEEETEIQDNNEQISENEVITTITFDKPYTDNKSSLLQSNILSVKSKFSQSQNECFSVILPDNDDIFYVKTKSNNDNKFQLMHYRYDYLTGNIIFLYNKQYIVNKPQTMSYKTELQNYYEWKKQQFSQIDLQINKEENLKKVEIIKTNNQNNLKTNLNNETNMFSAILDNKKSNLAFASISIGAVVCVSLFLSLRISERMFHKKKNSVKKQLKQF